MTVTGGKLTTYREMAQDTVDAVVDELPRRHRSTPLDQAPEAARLDAAGAVPARLADRHLVRRYGSMVDEVRRWSPSTRRSAIRSSHGLPYLRAEAVYAVRHEMATTLDDVLLRRTRAHLLDRAASRSPRRRTSPA